MTFVPGRVNRQTQADLSGEKDSLSESPQNVHDQCKPSTDPSVTEKGRYLQLESMLAEIKHSEAELEKKKNEWERWKTLEEAKWHEKLREKESAALRLIEDDYRAREKERADAADASLQEYSRLETRLRKSLNEIETRERQVQNADAARHADFTKKIAELQLQERVMKEEAKHSVDLEVSEKKCSPKVGWGSPLQESPPYHQSHKRSLSVIYSPAGENFGGN
uniref:Uncharacterized protein n=1 Tax=Odontella aurita TaxID=265563 RepID=A0A7S4HS34_9STRA|mmetsp:Transcript_14320/g.41982  ORF Transcript_14320/g.41982 Transcript_14320/m.41982 type:complete len:222 (+) Transcript_14320:189-854(+)